VRIDVVSIFPDYLAPLRLSLVGKAVSAGTIDLRVHDLRERTHDKHRTVDDTPYGGGPGMVMKPEPWGEALDAVLDDAGGRPRLMVPTPSGRRFTQEVAVELAAVDHLVFACGRYEGIDSRVMEHYADRFEVDEVSIGDYVLLEGPIYTKPPEWRGLAVPEVLLSGDHGRIAAWRREQALARTEKYRPDLLD